MDYLHSISVNPEKADRVKNWLVPSASKELQSFGGLASYYYQLIPRFAAIAKCLHQLVGPANNQKGQGSMKGEPVGTQCKETFNWESKYQETFDIHKFYLTSAPVLGYSNFS